MANGQWPIADSQLPIADSQLPTADSQEPSVRDPSGSLGSWRDSGGRIVTGSLHGDGSFDRRMRIVTHQLEILVAEAVDVFHRGIELHLRQRPRLARELEVRLVEVIAVKMQIAKGVHKSAGLQAADLSDHQCQQRIGSNVKRDSQ